MTLSDQRSRTGATGPTQGDRIAAGSLAVQTLGVLGVIVFYIVETARGETANVTRAVMSIVTIALLGLFVAIVARGLSRGREGARVPAIVWNVFLLPVGFDLVRGGQPVWGVLVLALALACIGGCAVAYRQDSRRS